MKRIPFCPYVLYTTTKHYKNYKQERVDDMLFSEELKNENQNLWDLSQNHPFVKSVAKGDLPIENYRFYMIDDLYFLEHYVNVHFYAAALATDYDVKKWLANRANDMVSGQTKAREKHRRIFNITQEELDVFTPAPTSYGYTSHLYREATSGSLGRIIAALLPCYWVYADIGLFYKDYKPENELYLGFVENYASERFQTASNYMVGLLDKIAEESDEKEKDKIKNSFVIATEYELSFWEMSWTQEKWLSNMENNKNPLNF